MTGVEATGDLVTGALLAGAIERTSGTRSYDDASHALCLNCGTALLGDYCHRCGQPGHVHRSLSAIWHDLAHGVLHFEGKIWNTLPLLAWRPGELTRRFIHGERARFISPMALFLFSVFLMFALFSAIGAHMEVPENTAPTEVAQAAARAKIPQAKAELERLKALRAAATTPEERERLSSRVEKAREEVVGLSEITGWKAWQESKLQTGWARLDAGLAKAKENPNLVLYKLQSSAYKFSWALIPISTPFVWLLFAWKRRFKVYDHAVFVTYSLSFMSLMVIALTILGEIGMPDDVIAMAALLIPPIHMYRQLRGAYGIGRFSALVRLAALLIFAFWALSAYFFLLIVMGVLG
ncbi:hypothetical protein SCH01S_52_00130 [Sphingomonas changbaiensis NBRC 104936]|uniref:DUF3667 domain-containing protein n=1 Tax=Sphingomonas changbaiensis NBRC 104936 TaxID=1219043 RepID=A0A0E9MSS3_9SPHN|nr:DUF3667 domain-containing protein [Sphingomonas changbaiensis]GAO40832.1 hypothetical protein SCH01S_52_00130 [Sphingomonas changbaiensis NBRC 104936]